MRLAVIGTGYVGLTAGPGFADFGNEVVCADVDAARVEALRRGECPIHEPGLPALLKENIAAGRLRFTTDIGEAVRGAEIVFLAVGTPSLDDGSADISQVLAAARGVISAADREMIIVTKSTVPIGTGDQIRELVTGAPYPITVASNPEFLKEGSAVRDFMQPERVIVGLGRTGQPLTEAEARAQETMRRLYAPIVRTNDRLLIVDLRSAEMTKYACNAYLATRISFINDIAALCEKVGADVEMVRRGMGMDSRIGPKFLFPGIGFGGSCLGKDIDSLIHTSDRHDVRLRIVRAARLINEGQFMRFGEKIRIACGGVSGKTVALWGMSFKPETDDVRDAPGINLANCLMCFGALVRGSDPVALANVQRYYDGFRAKVNDLSLHSDPYEAARGAHALVLCTEWRQYRQPDWRKLREVMAGDGIFDGRNIWDPQQVREAGFRYYGVGRP